MSDQNVTLLKLNKYNVIDKKNVCFINGLNKPAFTSKDALAYLNQNIFTITNYPKVILCIGCNDYFFNWEEVMNDPNGKHDSIVPLAEFHSNLKRIIEILIIGGIKPVLTSLAPINHYDYFASLLNKYDGKKLYHFLGSISRLKEIAQTYDQVILELSEKFHLNYINLHKCLTKKYFNQVISENNFHLNNKIEDLIINLL